MQANKDLETEIDSEKDKKAVKIKELKDLLSGKNKTIKGLESASLRTQEAASAGQNWPGSCDEVHEFKKQPGKAEIGSTQAKNASCLETSHQVWQLIQFYLFALY